MEKKIEHIKETFKLLKDELKDSRLPSASKSNWNGVLDTPFTTLISCILSLRTKDQVTDKASIQLLKKYNTPEKISKLSTQKIKSLIFPVGFYKTKSKRIKEISKTLIKNYNGKVPDDFNELLKIKGVGRKTANIVMLYGHKKQGFLPIES